MEKKELLSAIDKLLHKNAFLAEKLQETILDNAYHFLLGVLLEGEIPDPHTHSMLTS